MKKTKHLIILSCLLLMSLYGKGQMALQHSYTVSTDSQGPEIVNLSISGKKIMVPNNNVINFYNLDFSLWKTITLPMTLPGGYNLRGNLLYPSEELFNLDPLLEIATFYYVGSTSEEGLFVVNETGVAIDSIGHFQEGGGTFTVYNTAPGVFQAVAFGDTATTGTPAPTVSIYSLPGTIPCDICGNGLGLANMQTKTNGVSEPVPNPSSQDVKITFTLPQNATQGEIDIYNMNGQKLKSFKVDNTFGYITVNDSEFPAGVYYYNLIANGEVSVTRKMLVIK